MPILTLPDEFDGGAFHRAADSGDQAALLEFIKKPLPEKHAGMALQSAGMNGGYQTVLLLEPFSDINSKNAALAHAAWYGYLNIVEFLAPKVERDAQNQAFWGACKMGCTDVALFLAKNIKQDAIAAGFYRAGEEGHLELITKLSKVYIFRKKDRPRGDEALFNAAEAGNAKMVSFLLDYSHPRESKTEALVLACERRYSDVFDVLYPFCDPHRALEILRSMNAKENQMELIVRRMARDSKSDLLGVVSAPGTHAQKKEKRKF